MRLRLLMGVVAVVVMVFSPSAAASSSAKLVGFPPPKHQPPPPQSSTTTAPTTTVPVTTQRTSTTTTTAAPVTTTTATTAPPTTTWMPAAPVHVFYAMRPDHNIGIDWDYDGPTACFFADSVSLCDRTVRTGTHFTVIVVPSMFGGTLPLCVVLSTHIGPLSTAAPPQCQGSKAN